MFQHILLSQLPLIIYNPSMVFDKTYFATCADSGALPVFDTEYFPGNEIIKKIEKLAKADHLFGVKIDISNSETIDFLIKNFIPNLDLVVFSYNTPEQLKQFSLKQFQYKFVIETTDIDLTETLQRLAPNGLILKGNEAPGKVSKYTSFILMQWYLKNTELPVFIHGGVGMYTAAGIFAAGAAGIVLDNQLYCTDESPVSDNFKSFINTVTENDTQIIGEATGVQYRFFAKLGTKIIKTLKTKESSLTGDENGNDLISNDIKKEITGLSNVVTNPLQSLFYLGQDAAFAKSFTGNINAVVDRLFQNINRQLEAVDEHDPLVQDSPLAREHGTKYPVMQGPMANISDNAAFAKAIFDNGGLPFFAMGNLPADLSEAVIANGKETVKSYGCGLIGIETFNKTIHTHFDLVKKYKVPFALFAGGVPSQVNELEKAGTKTYLHTPNMSMLTNAVDSGCSRFIFEGCEAGGHVGTLTSFILWESALTELMKENQESLKGKTIVFAGGISSVYASCFITGLSSLLCKLGVKVGIQVGSVYLFSKEIVDLKSVGSLYQKTIADYSKTIITGNTVGLASRTVPTPFAKTLVEKEHQRISEGVPLGQRKTSFEADNLGSLMIGAKGFLPDIKGSNNGKPTYFNEQEQHDKGNFLVGDSLAFLKPGILISDIHNMYFHEKKQLTKCLNNLETLTSPEAQINDEIAIIGAGCILPDAETPEALWENIISKKYSIKEMPDQRFDKDLYYNEDKKAEDKTYTSLAGVVDHFSFDHQKFGYTEQGAKKLSRSQKMLLETAFQAVENSGYLSDNLTLNIDNAEKAGIIVASCLGSELGNNLQLKYYYPLIHSYLDGIHTFKALSEKEQKSVLDTIKQKISNNDTSGDPADGVALSAEASRIAHHLGTTGPAYVVDAACATSFAALDSAVKELLSGRLDMVVTGGINTNLSPEAFIGFGKMGAISAKGSWPFDQRADGFVLGEGCAAFVLKRLKDAVRDGDSVLGVIKGIGSSSDGKGKAIAAPNPKGQELALKRCYEKIKTEISMSDIGYIEAHGTSTIMGDQAEMETLVKTYQSDSPIGVSSIKSQIGHLLGGAGAAGLIKVLLAIKNKTIPPNGQFNGLSENLNLKESKLYIIDTPVKWHADSGKSRKAAISSYGFGGINYHAVIEEFCPTCTLLPRKIFSDPAFNYNDNRIVVTGIGSVLPGAKTTEVFKNRLKQNDYAATGSCYDSLDNPYYTDETDQAFNLSGLSASVVEDYKFNNVKYRIPPMAAKSIDPAQLFALDAASQAIDSSGLSEHLDNGNKTAVIIGTLPGKQHSENILRVRSAFLEKIISDVPGINADIAIDIAHKLKSVIRSKYPKTTEDSVPGFLSNIVSGRIANYFGCNGANFVVDAACASSAKALDVAAKGLTSGDFNFVITGGVDAALYPQMMFQYKSMGFLNDKTPRIMGQGAAIAVLTTLQTAKKLKMPILGEVSSFSFETGKTAVKSTMGPVEKQFGCLRAAGTAVEIAKNLSLDAVKNRSTSVTATVGGIKASVTTGLLPPFLSGKKRNKQIPGTIKPAGTIALLSGQGSQYPGMMKGLYESFDEIRALMDKAESIFMDIRGYSLLEIMFTDDERKNLTENTQPAVFLSTAAIYSFLKSRGFAPDYYIGHSVGEFSALYCSSMLSFDDAFRLVLKRASLMKSAAETTPGRIMVVFKEAEESKRLIQQSGINNIYIANKNSNNQTAVSGDKECISAFCNYLSDECVSFSKLSLSGAFHTPLFKSAADKLHDYLKTITFQKGDCTKIISNVTGEAYPDDIEAIKELLVRQITSPVEFIKSIESVYSDENTSFIEIGPGKLLNTLLKNISIGPCKAKAAMEIKNRQQESFHSFLGFLTDNHMISETKNQKDPDIKEKDFTMRFSKEPDSDFNSFINDNETKLKELLYTEYLKTRKHSAIEAFEKFDFNPGKIVVSGVSIGLPGKNKRVFDPENFKKLISGTSFIEPLPLEYKDRMVDKNVTRLHKASDGNAKFVEITSTEDVIQLAGQLGYFNLEEEYGIKKEYDMTIALAMAAGIEALNDANIPLVMGYKTTSTGTKIPTGYALPKELQGSTGVILSSLWPYSETLIKEITAYYYNKFYVQPYNEFEKIYYHLMSCVTDETIKEQITGWFFKVKERRSEFTSYKLERDFAHNITPLGSAHFAQYIKAKGPNIQMSGACASTTQAIGIAEDWIRAGRCERVIIIGGETPTSEAQSQWIGSGFLSLGAASIKRNVDEAAKPFDVERNGTILGSGAVSMIIEKEEPVRKRGFKGQAEVLGTHIGNTAFHTYNIDVNGIADEMDRFVSKVEKRHGLKKEEYSKQLVFMSHETFTPARGGSADAEITALRKTYPDTCSEILISNTKGYTGHTLGAALEDAVLIKVLQSRTAPPIANLKQVSDNFKDLRLNKTMTKGDFEYGFHIAAGFGSHLAFAFFKRIEEEPVKNNIRYQSWLNEITDSSEATVVKINNTLCAEAKGLKPEKKRKEEIPAPAFKAETVNTVKQDVRPEPEIKPIVVHNEQPQEPEITREVPPVSGSTEKPLSDVIKEIIAEQTGYDFDMLENDLDLEADLGIDTVKQVEIFGKISSTYDMKVPENLKLKDLNTITKLSDYIQNNADITTPEIKPETQIDEPVYITTPPQIPTVEDEIKQIISEQTGYDIDMLEETLDLEADLGIDTVKQVEIFGKISSNYNMKVPENLKLKDLNTIKKLAGYLKKNADIPEPVTEAKANTEKQVSTVQSKERSFKSEIKIIIAEQTGYEVDMLDDTLDLEADLGIDTVKQVEIFGKISGNYNLKVPENLKLKDLNTISRLSAYLEDKVDLPEIISETPAVKPLIQTENPVKSEIKHISEIKQIIAEQTGYETDMLDDTLDLEADLGIDTVKQVEIFGNISKKYNLKVPENLKLKDLNTIEKLGEYILSKTGQTDGTPVKTDPVKTVSPEIITPINSGVQRFIVKLVPAPRPTPRTDLFKNKRILITHDKYGFAAELTEKVRQAGGRPISVGNHSSAKIQVDLTSPVQTEQVFKSFAASNDPVDGLIHLAPLDYYFQTQKPFGFLKMKKSGADELNTSMGSFFAIIKALESQLDKPGALISALSFNSVIFPYSEGFRGNIHPAFAGMAGMMKTINKEFKDTLVRIVDFASDKPIKDQSSIIDTWLKELLSDEARVETGYKGKSRFIPTLVPKTVTDEKSIIENRDKILVTGGALGITFEILKKMAEKYNSDLIIIGRSAIFDLDDAYLLPDADDKSIMASVKVKMAGSKPLEIKKAVEKIKRTRTAVLNIKMLQKIGIKVDYESADVTDFIQVNRVVKKHKTINGIIHAAGLEESQFIAKKEQASFERVTEVKVKGLQNLIRAMKSRNYRFLITFSSVTARFGNEGQIDYTGANDMIGKMIQREKIKTPSRFYKVYAWTAWSGAGMAENETVKKVLEMRGITFLPLEDGIRFFMDDLNAVSDTEVVISGPDAAADTDNLMNISPTEIKPAAGDLSKTFPLIDSQVFKTDTEVEFTRNLSLERDLFLLDHSMEDTPVFLGATGIETMSEAAVAFAGDTKKVVEISDFSIPYGIKILKERDKELTISAKQDIDDNTFKCSISSVFKNQEGIVMGSPTRHYQGKITVDSTLPEGVSVDLPDFTPVHYDGSAEDLIYHPKRLFMDDLFKTLTDILSFDGDLLITRFRDTSQKDFFQEIKTPSFQSDVVAVDAMFQTGGLLEFFTTSSLVLPYKISSMKFYNRVEKGADYYCLTRKTVDGTETNTYQIDLVDADGNLFIRAENFEMVKLGRVEEEYRIADKVRFAEMA